MRAILVTLVVIGLTLSAGTRAEDAPGGYIGLSVGQTKANDGCDGIVGSCDDSDVGWKVFGGYQMNRHFGVEAGYVNLGEVSGNDTFAGSFSAEAWGLFAAGVGTLPIGDRFGVFGKLGIAFTQTDVSTSNFGDADDSSTDFMFGVGGLFNITKNLSVRVEWERFVGVGETDLTEDIDVDLISAGVVFKF